MPCYGLYRDLEVVQRLAGLADPAAPLVVGLARIDGRDAFSLLSQADRHVVYEYDHDRPRGWRLSRDDA